MRITYLFMLAFTFTLMHTQAQVIGGSEEKLAKLFNSGKHESCLYKAENLTFKEDYAKDPEPYLYMSMCFYELSKYDDPMIQEDYKDGEKQAIKSATKFVKKDKEGEMYLDNIEYINTLKDIQFALVKSYFDENKYKKAASSAKLYNRLNKDEDFTILYFIGICEVLSNNLSQGDRNMEEAKTEIESKNNSGTVKIDKRFKTIISSGFLKYSEYLVENNNLEQASKNLDFGLKLLPNDGYLKVQYNMVNKSMEGNTE